MNDTVPVVTATKKDENNVKVINEKELQASLSRLFDTVNVLTQNDDYYYKEQEKINEQLLELQKHIEEIQVKNKLHCQITRFRDAIKNHHNQVKYFDNIKDKPEVYDELMHNFKDGMIAQPMLYKYFNMVYEYDFFSNNKILLKLLQGIDRMFSVSPMENTRYKRRKRYKILEEVPLDNKKRKKSGLKFVKKNCLDKY